MLEIASLLIGKMVDILPSFLLRLYFSPEKVSQKVCIELRGENPISFSFSDSVPSIDLWFRITNFSHIHLVLDRLLIDMWFGQPTFNFVDLNRYPIPALNKFEDIYCRVFLTAEQKKRIENNRGILGLSNRGIKIYLTAYFDSKIGPLKIKKTIERMLI